MLRRGGPPKGSHNNPHGRPRSDTLRLTRAARERFDRQVAEGIDDIFAALFQAGTKEKDTAALALLLNRAVPVRRLGDQALLRRVAHDQRFHRRQGPEPGARPAR